MHKIRLPLRVLILAIVAIAFATVAQAQATRTWVSGVGDDFNPCSRTAPCKTFAGAISKTFINGEINALDPGGFGTINITKSITLDGGTGSGWASILASSTVGVTVNIAAGNANDPLRQVILRHLSINGTGASGTVGTRTGTNGINYIQGLQVIVEDCQILNFNTTGIRVALTANGAMSVQRTTIDSCQVGFSQTTTGGVVNSSITDSVIQGSVGNGLQVDAGTVNVSDTVVDRNLVGLRAQGAVGSVLNVDNCTVTSNTNGGIQSATAQSTVRVSNNTVRRNGTGLQNTAGVFESCKNNKVRGNTAETSGVITDIAALGFCTQ